DGHEGAALDAQVDVLQRDHLGLGAGRVHLAKAARLDDRGRRAHRAARSPVMRRSPARTSPEISVAVPSLAPTRTTTGSGRPLARRYTVARVAPTRAATAASQRAAWASSRVARKPAKSSLKRCAMRWRTCGGIPVAPPAGPRMPPIGPPGPRWPAPAAGAAWRARWRASIAAMA